MTPAPHESHRTTPLEIFCSYAHKDDAYRQELEQHLSRLSWQNKATLWHDRRITAGTNWSEVIDSHLETASIILLLVSSDFLASQYCYGIEMQRALERHNLGMARVIPIIVRSCDWQNAPFALLQVLPTDGKPITTWPDRDTAWTEVVKGIRQVIDEALLSDVSASATAVGPTIWNVPFARNPFFTGRKELLHFLKRGFLRGLTFLGSFLDTTSKLIYIVKMTAISTLLNPLGSHFGFKTAKCGNRSGFK